VKGPTSAGPLVSIITPTLNQGRFIEATLRSVMQQTYPRIEHIVVDGGSSDGTLDILRAHEHRYALSWTSEPDEGMYDAINRGLARSTGEIVAYLNSDDVYTPWAVESVVEHLQRSRADVVFGDAILTLEDDVHPRLAFQPPFSARILRRTGTLVQPAVFWRRRVQERLGAFDRRLRYVADMEYWLRAQQHFAFERVDEVLTLERHHPDAKTSANADAVARETRLVRRAYGSTSPGAAVLRVADRVAAWAWRRRAWLAFLRSTMARRPRRWPRLLAEARPAISWPRAAALQIPLLGRTLGAGAVEWPDGWIGRLTGNPPVADEPVADQPVADQ
jgi:glycosyltransferase involved in cell wall biosynthesis